MTASPDITGPAASARQKKNATPHLHPTAAGRARLVPALRFLP
jgi:hypothetical protein